MDAYQEWTVLPHGPLEKISENLWRLEGRLPQPGLKRVMTIARMESGELVIHNGIALEESLMQEVEAWGKPGVLVVPNGWHRLDARIFKKRYPSIRVLAPRGSRQKIEKVVAVDGTYDDFAGDDKVSLTHLDGIKEAEGVLIVRSADGRTVVFNDAIFNLPHGKGAMGLIFRILGSTGGPKVTRIMKVFMVKDRAKLRSHLERIASEPDLVRIIVSHGDPMTERPGEILRSIAAGL